MDKKIKNLKEITKIAENLRKRGKKIITFNGSFDILHLGHIQSLKEAKKQGDILIILLNSDNSVRGYKGPNHPVNPEKERAEVLAAIKYVDYVAIFDEINPKEILKKIKPDIHCNGSDWGKNCLERKVVEENEGRIHILKWRPGLSTSALIQKILDIRSRSEIKAIFLDRDGTINKNNIDYVFKIEDFKLFPETITALKKLSKTNYKIIIVTNQSGIAKGYYAEAQMKKLHRWMVAEFKKKGVRIDGIYYCPHSPDDDCFCRKPKIGMFLRAGKDFNLNLSKSWMIGDDPKDIIAGREANIKTIKIGDRMLKDLKLEPNRYVKNILEAVSIITKNE